MGLADAAGTRQGEQPHIGPAQQPTDSGKVLLPAHERRGLGRQRARAFGVRWRSRGRTGAARRLLQGSSLACGQAQRLRQQPQRPSRVAGGGAVGVAGQPLEPGRVDQLGVNLQPVAGRPCGQPRGHRPERPAQRPHPALQGVGRVAGRAVAPQVLDQPVGGHHPPGVDQQVGQQRTLLGPRHGDWRRAVEHLQRPQDPELHHASVPTANPQRHISAPAHGAITTHPHRRRTSRWSSTRSVPSWRSC
jgi:hypothetical protein